MLLAVSGGPDSLALLRAMLALKQTGAGRLVTGHFNHRLRPGEADADQAFVETLCRELGLSCRVGSANVARQAGIEGDGLEAASRTARYEFLQATAEEIGARYVVTAHTADDQAETILHRIVRGTGLAGLGGMRRVRPMGPAVSLIRPLLDFRRSELQAYLTALEQPYRDDPSNRDRRFTRNRIRHVLLPTLTSQINPAAADALLRLGRLATEVQQVVDRLVDEQIERSIKAADGPDIIKDAVEIDCGELTSCPRYVVRELLITLWRQRGWPRQAMGYAAWDQLAGMVVAEGDDSDRRMFPGAITAERKYDRLRLARASG